MATKLTATRPDGRTIDDAELRAWYVDDSDVGRYLVATLGGPGLGLGDTPDEAIADAARAMGEPVHVETDAANMGEDCIVCVLIEAEEDEAED